jgi:multiple sugar transport system permease protein
MKTHAAVFSKKESRVFLWVVMAPTLAAFLAIRIVPILQTFVLSFFNWSLIDGVGQFVGFRNYAAVLNDPLFYDAFANTLILAAAGSILSVVLGLAFAVVIVNITKAATYEAIIFFPVVLTYIPICMVWVWLFNWDNGLINYALQQVGLPRVAWLGSKAMTMVSIIIISVWKVVGYYMIIFSVGLKAIPRTYYEAAVIDGATKSKIFVHITLPLLKPVTLLACVIAVINFLKIFTQVYAVVGGQIGQATHLGVLVYDIYNRAFTYFKLGEGAAESMLFLAVLMMFTLIQFKALGGENE